jgi:hypothetical protein
MKKVHDCISEQKYWSLKKLRGKKWGDKGMVIGMKGRFTPSHVYLLMDYNEKFMFFTFSHLAGRFKLERNFFTRAYEEISTYLANFRKY